MMAREFTIEDLLALKPGGSYRIDPSADGRQFITVNWPDGRVEHYTCHSPGIANQLRLHLSNEGLAGYVSGAQ